MEPREQTGESATKRVVAQVLATTFGVLASLGWLTAGVTMVALGGKFRDIFADFGVALPELTQFFLRLAQNWPLVAVLVAAAIAGTVLAAVKHRPAPSIASFVLAGLVLVVFILAMQVPLMAMNESLSGG